MEEVSIMEEVTRTHAESVQILKDEIMSWVRRGRDARLAASDYIFLPDVTVTTEFKDALIAHRQVLRDFPAAYATILSNMSDDDLCCVTNESIPYPEQS